MIRNGSSTNISSPNNIRLGLISSHSLILVKVHQRQPGPEAPNRMARPNRHSGVKQTAGRLPTHVTSPHPTPMPGNGIICSLLFPGRGPRDVGNRQQRPQGCLKQAEVLMVSLIKPPRVGVTPSAKRQGKPTSNRSFPDCVGVISFRASHSSRLKNIK